MILIRSVKNWNNLQCITAYAFLKIQFSEVFTFSSLPNVTRWKPRCFCQLIVVNVKMLIKQVWISNQQGMPNESQVLVIKHRVRKLQDTCVSESSSLKVFPAQRLDSLLFYSPILHSHSAFGNCSKRRFQTVSKLSLEPMFPFSRGTQRLVSVK